MPMFMPIPLIGPGEGDKIRAERRKISRSEPQAAEADFPFQIIDSAENENDGEENEVKGNRLTGTNL